jgi:polysaccharide export outer membrane protein
MRGARLLLAVCAALALAGCVHEQYAQQPSPRATVPAPPARHLYSTSPAYAQQAYEQPAYQMEAQPASADDRGLFNSRTATPVYAAPAPRSAPPPPPAVGGPYVAATSSYASAPAAVVVAAVSERPYTLDAGDKLRVVVFGQDGITNSYTVDASGKVNLPLIGAVTARGLTNQQLADAIATRLKQGFVREPHVSVEVETYRPFFILGEVTTPGQYPYVVNMTAETAIAIAGGFAPRAFKTTVEVTRKVGGQQVRTQVPLDYPVRPGDTILVEERWF